MVECDICRQEILEDHDDFTVKVEGKTYHYCSHEHLSTSDTVKQLTQGSLSSLILNKTFFDVFAPSQASEGSTTPCGRRSPGPSSWTR